MDGSHRRTPCTGVIAVLQPFHVGIDSSRPSVGEFVTYGRDESVPIREIHSVPEKCMDIIALCPYILSCSVRMRCSESLYLIRYT